MLMPLAIPARLRTIDIGPVYDGSRGGIFDAWNGWECDLNSRDWPAAAALLRPKSGYDPGPADGYFGAAGYIPHSRRDDPCNSAVGGAEDHTCREDDGV